MGKVRPAHIKRAAEELLKRYPDRFSQDFKENRRILDELAFIESKRVKNRIAGYIASGSENKTRESE